MEYVELSTKDVGRIASTVSSEMLEEMKQTISDGRPYAFMQFKVGSVFIIVEVPAWESPNEDSVQVLHQDAEHRSPRIEEAIREKLPDWSQAERDAQESRRMWEAQERHQWLNRYN